MKSGFGVLDDENEDLAFRSMCVFRGIEYVVSATTANNGRTLVVEVEDKLTADQWRGRFDATYIESLTQKTGNFKQFPVFVSMLQSALEKNSDSVALDLLTYSDLELLRNRKVGTTAKPIANSQALAQQNKRYLILVYSVEFDRIHYPLPLPYQGKPDPVHLQNVVRQLNDEIRKLKTAQIGLQDEDYEQLKEEYEAVLQEKNSLEMEVESLKLQMKGSTGLAVSKEVRVLKKVVQNLELEMVKEKNRYQRQMTKKTADVKRLTLELQEVLAKERTLQIRVKSLTNELAMYKRNRRTPIPAGRPSTANSAGRRPARGVARLADRSALSLNHSIPRQRSQSRSQSRNRPQSRSIQRERSLSKERHPLSQRSSNRAKTPTFRFDPTSFIEEKRRKQRDSQERRKRRVMSGLTPGSGESYRGRTRARVVTGPGRTASRERYRGSILRDRSSSADSRRSSNGSITRTRQRPTVAWEFTPEHDTDRPLRKRSSTPDPERYPGGNRLSREEREYNDNMVEIDARLNALQQYMQDLGAAG